MRKPDKSDTEFRIALAIIWGGAAILGILTGGGLIFYSMHTSHAEKQNLINQFYDNGGNTDSGAAKHAGGYRFECQN